MTRPDPRVRTFLAEAGAHEQPTPEGTGWIATDSGLVVIERADGCFDVARWGKGRTEAVVLTGATKEVVDVFLVLHHGNDWRDAHGLAPLRLSDHETRLPAGFHVADGDGRRSELLVDGPPGCVLGGLQPRSARTLAQALAVPFDDLIAFFRDPRGRPAFPQQTGAGAVPIAAGPPVRAGQYAWWRGVEYSASFGGGSTKVLLRAPAGSTPEGFTADAWGRLQRVVDRSEVDLLETVATVAVWGGGRVEVLRVEGDVATIQQWSSPPPDDRAVHAVENGLWEARVPTADLTEVAEQVTSVAP